MNLLDRILLALNTIITLVLSLILFCVSIALFPLHEISNFILNLEYNMQFVVITLVVSLLFLLISLKLLFSGLSRNRPRSALIKNTELGLIHVSLNTLDTLTQKAVRDFSEVKDVKSTIILFQAGGIKVNLQLMIMPEVAIPELTQSVQRKVKDYIESLSGIIVNEVEINVVNLFMPPQRPKIQ